MCADKEKILKFIGLYSQHPEDFVFVSSSDDVQTQSTPLSGSRPLRSLCRPLKRLFLSKFQRTQTQKIPQFGKHSKSGTPSLFVPIRAFVAKSLTPPPHFFSPLFGLIRFIYGSDLFFSPLSPIFLTPV